MSTVDRNDVSSVDGTDREDRVVPVVLVVGEVGGVVLFLYGEGLATGRVTAAGAVHDGNNEGAGGRRRRSVDGRGGRDLGERVLRMLTSGRDGAAPNGAMRSSKKSVDLRTTCSRCRVSVEFSVGVSTDLKLFLGKRVALIRQGRQKGTGEKGEGERRTTA